MREEVHHNDYLHHGHLTLATSKQIRSGSIHTLIAFTLKRQERAPVFFQLAHANSLMACDAMLTSSSTAGGGQQAMSPAVMRAYAQ